MKNPFKPFSNFELREIIAGLNIRARQCGENMSAAPTHPHIPEIFKQFVALNDLIGAASNELHSREVAKERENTNAILSW